jgi:hypothetical protein
MLRSAIAALAITGIALPAFAGSAYIVETAAPVAEKRIVAESAVWTCEGTVCTAELDRRKPTVRICRKVAKEVGEITAMRNASAALTAEELAECNSALTK